MGAMDKADRGNVLLKQLTITASDTDNNTQAASRLLAAPENSQQIVSINNLEISFRTADPTTLKQDDLPAGYYQIFSGPYAAAGSAVSGNAAFAAVTMKRAFASGTPRDFHSEQMRNIQSRKGEELFLVVFIDDVQAVDIEIHVEGNVSYR